MKNYIYYCTAFLFLLFGCSGDGSSETFSNDGGEIDKGDGQGGSLAVFALAGDYLYTVDHASLNVFNVFNETEPVKVNTVTIGNDIETLFARDQYLYIGSQEGMYIYSLANPEAPTLVSAVQHFTACDPVVANETHSFVTLHSNSWCGNMVNALNVYDTSDPNNPFLINVLEMNSPKGLGLYGNYLFVCDDKIKIFDITNPENLVQVGVLQRICHDVIIRGDDLFAIGEFGLYRYQLNPDNISDIVEKSSISF